MDRLVAVELVTHSGERGAAHEEILRQFLRAIVPNGFEVATGFVIDAVGGQSLQQDLIIVRRDYHPKFQIGGARFYPVEAVSAVVEVKSTLNATTLRAAIENARSVKALDRTGGGRNYIPAADGSQFQTVVTTHDNHLVQAFVVGARCATGVDAAVQTVRQSLASHPWSTWINGLAVADSWYLSYKVPPGEPRSFPCVADEISIYEKNVDGNVEPLIDLAHDLWWWLRASPVIDARPDSYVKVSAQPRQVALPNASDRH